MIAFAAIFLTSQDQLLEINPVQTMAANESIPVGTETFKNEDIGLAFQYPKNWKLETKLTDNYYVIVLRVDENHEPITVHVGSEYFGTSGLDSETTSIAGFPAINIQDQIYGVHKDGSYYTFDLRSNPEQQQHFKRLINSVELF